MCGKGGKESHLPTICAFPDSQENRGRFPTNFELRCYAPEKGLKTCKTCGITPQLGGGYRMFYFTA